jgi:hypothetical protein
LYIDFVTSYGHVDGVFQTFLAIVHHPYDPLYTLFGFFNLILAWSMQGFFSPCIYVFHKRDVPTTCLSYVSKLDWLNAIEVVKQ